MEFKTSLTAPTPSPAWPPILQGLWYDAKGDWVAAHGVAQDGEGTPDFDRLHAYLHRKEGDESNARYWYRRANAAVFEGTLDQEWAALVATHIK